MSLPTAKIQILGVGVVDPGMVTSIDSAARDPLEILGSKGLRYKDRATRLALASGALALEMAGMDPRIATGVACASNRGNLDTVERVARTIAASHASDSSPLDLPNASSNIIASSCAIRFGLKGCNLMVASGQGSGFQALWLASHAIRSGRVERMLVVASEGPPPEGLSFSPDTARNRAEGSVAFLLGRDDSVSGSLACGPDRGADRSRIRADGMLDAMFLLAEAVQPSRSARIIRAFVAGSAGGRGWFASLQ